MIPTMNKHSRVEMKSAFEINATEESVPTEVTLWQESHVKTLDKMSEIENALSDISSQERGKTYSRYTDNYMRAR